MKGKAVHVAIIMDGNGRWAQGRGLPRAAGHVAGVAAVRRIVESAVEQGIGVLTLFAFSSDNWKRPGPEVQALLRLLERSLRAEAEMCVRQGVRIEVMGRRDRLPARVVRAVEAAEQATAAASALGRTLRLRLAVDYSSRDAIVQAAARGAADRADIAHQLEPSRDGPTPDVDLLIRTGGEQRLSDFLLWESAYAELYFTDVAWPDFDNGALTAAMAEFRKRQRRFGAVLPDAQRTAVAS